MVKATLEGQMIKWSYIEHVRAIILHSCMDFKTLWHSCSFETFFSSPGRSPGRAIVLPPASVLALAAAAVSVLAKSLTLKFFM